ncbi:hypothetical protein EYV94_21950 [Puteibacter caeruleilacunae]|nr:hypothetical protein EYV94_21950 [Puteibacter caeruleilacunae]
MNKLYILILFTFFATLAYGQISAPKAAAETQTNYTATSTNDPIFIFCANDNMDYKGELTVSNPFSESATYEWQKFNINSGDFEFYQNGTTGAESSTISGLQNGCYRMILTTTSENRVYNAWVINSWVNATGAVTESNCELVQLEGSFTNNSWDYRDITSNESLTINPQYEVSWMDGDTKVGAFLSSKIDPQAEDKTYVLIVNNQFGCPVEAEVSYTSLVPKAEFNVSPNKGQAPLVSTISNNSLNADSYQWHFYKSEDQITKEYETNTEVDSLMLPVAFNTEPNFEFTYENSGWYRLKLIAIKNNDNGLICKDSIYFNNGQDNFIKVDTSFVKAPWAIAPKDESSENKDFFIKIQSLKSMKVTVFNRWGKKLASYSADNIALGQEEKKIVIWNGKVNGRYATPGVYYYVVDAIGRDDKKRKMRGFFHLFRDK